MGAIFAVMKLNSSPCGVHYKERANAHPHCSLAKRDLENPEGWVSLVGGEEGTYWMEWGCGGRGVLGGGKKERDHKQSANDLKHTNNTEEINGMVHSLLEKTAECFLFLDWEWRDSIFLVHLWKVVKSLCVFEMLGGGAIILLTCRAKSRKESVKERVIKVS